MRTLAVLAVALIGVLYVTLAPGCGTLANTFDPNARPVPSAGSPGEVVRIPTALTPDQAERLERIEGAIAGVVHAAVPAEPSPAQNERLDRIELGVAQAATAAQAVAPLANLVWPGVGLLITTVAGGIAAAFSQGRHKGWDEKSLDTQRPGGSP